MLPPDQTGLIKPAKYINLSLEKIFGKIEEQEVKRKKKWKWGEKPVEALNLKKRLESLNL